MSDLVATCPECGTSSLGSCGRSYWCPECSLSFAKAEAVERPPRGSQEPTRGLAATLADMDADEVSAE